MNNQDILRPHKLNLDVRLDNSEYYDLEFAPSEINDDIILSSARNIVNPLFTFDGITIPSEFEINKEITINNQDIIIRPRTERGWSLNFVFNKENIPWSGGSTFYYWGIKDEISPLLYADNNLSFSFTSDARIEWKSYHYSGYCDTESGYTPTYYISSGQTPILCTGGTSTDFNVTITFTRYFEYSGCSLENEGGLNDLITGWTVTNPLDVMTGATEIIEKTEVLNKAWLEERSRRLGILKIYLNGNPIYKILDWEEIIPSLRGTGTTISQIWGGGTSGCENLHTGTTMFDIKRIEYFEEPINFNTVKYRYNNITSTGFTITECNTSCEDFILIYPPRLFWEYDIDTRLLSSSEFENGQMSMYFENSWYGDEFTDQQIGDTIIRTGGIPAIVNSELPFPQETPDIKNGMVEYQYEPGNQNVVTYAIPGEYNVKFYTTGTKTTEATRSITLDNLPIIGTLDLSEFIHISELNINGNNPTEIIFPTETNPHIGCDFKFNNIETLSTIDMSLLNMNIFVVGDMFQITNCPDVTAISLPLSGRESYFQIENMASLTELHSHGLFKIENSTSTGSTQMMTVILKNCPSLTSLIGLNGSGCGPLDMSNNPILSYYSIKHTFPNLTKISGTISNPIIYDLTNNNFSSSMVDAALIDFDKISTGGYSNRILLLTGNSAPGSMGLMSKYSLELKGFEVQVDS